jgi:hypothetical protein
LDIRLEKMFGEKAKRACVYRVPDKPGIDDLNAIGIGNASYDESKNGLLVLDECGTWFNSRQWADKERQQVINWFLHARKLGWDIIFIVQNIQIVDKQARLTMAEHVVYCRRLDKMTIPFLSIIWKLFTGSPLHLPRMHVASVRYGDQPTSLIVDRWWYLGLDLYDCYDTKQVFSDFYPHSTYQLLPPWYAIGRYRLPLTWSKAMRLTRIHWKRFSRPVIAGAFFCVGIAAAILFREPVEVVAQAEAVEQGVEQPATDDLATASASSVEAEPAAPARPVHDRYAEYVITGHMLMAGRDSYFIRSPDGAVTPLHASSKGDLDVIPRNNCHLRVISVRDVQDYADIYHPGCVPNDVKPVLTGAIDVIADQYARGTVPSWPSTLGYSADNVGSPVVTGQLAKQ